jgi:ABC-2 type transport system ATP-binding protein
MANMTIPAVKIDDLSFRYAGESKMCFSHLNLEIEAGERFGLFGPNGAGKTTLMNLMTGLFTIREGTISIFGDTIKEKGKIINSSFGFVPQDFSFFHELSPVENLEFFGAWSGLNKQDIRNRTRELLEILGLTAVQNRPADKFSGGMKRRLNLAIGVIHLPRLLFLDEPTVGVDVQTRLDIVKYLVELNRKGTTLIYSSHQLNEAEELCTKIALMDKGKIIASGDLNKLLSQNHQDGLEGLYLNLTRNNFMIS